MLKLGHTKWFGESKLTYLTPQTTVLLWITPGPFLLWRTSTRSQHSHFLNSVLLTVLQRCATLFMHPESQHRTLYPWFSMAASVYQHALGIQFLYCCLILGKMNSTRIISQDSRHSSPASLKCRLAGVIRGHHMQVLRGWGL